MNRTLPTVIAFLSFQISKLEKVLLQFSPIKKENYVWLSTQSVQNRKGLSKTFGFLLVLLFVVSFANAATRTSKSTGGNWNATGTWVGGVVPIATDDVVIATTGASSVILNVNTAALNSLTVSSGSTLTVSPNFTVSATTITLNGTYINSSTGAITGIMTVGATGIYRHNINGGVIPTATWNITSTCLITGVTGTALTGINQTFGNFTWDCASQSTWVGLVSTSMSILGNLTISNTNSNPAGTGSPWDFSIEQDITIGKDFIINANAIYRICYQANRVLNVNGNVTINGGQLLINSSGGTYANGTLNVKGNFNFASGYINARANNPASTSNIVFNGTTAQVYTSGGTIESTANSNTINFTVNNGAYLQMGTGASPSTIDACTAGTDTFTIRAGGKLGVTSPNGISTGTAVGNIQTDGTRTYTAAANYEYNGTSVQVTGNGLTATTPANLTINNSAGVTLSAPTTVSGVVTLTSGLLTTTAANLLSVTNTATTAIVGGSAASYINGPVKWTLPFSLGSGSTYNFPVGSSTYLPFSLVNPITGTGPVAVTAQVQAFSANAGGTFDATLASLSSSEYWSLATTNFTNSSVSLTRQTAITPLDAVAGSTTLTGPYTTLAGTAGANGVTSSNSIGLNRFFVLAGRMQTITTSAISGSPFCPGTSVSVPFTITGTFTSGNIFTAQLSDSSGSFTSPTTIGTLTQTTAGTIAATIPSGTTTGTAYRIRVISSTPVRTGSDNGTNLTINPVPNNTGTGFSSVGSFCVGGSPTITFDANDGSGTPPYVLSYQNSVGTLFSATIATDAATAFLVTPAPTVTTSYTLLSITDKNGTGCQRTTGFGDSTAMVTVNAIPTVSNAGVDQSGNNSSFTLAANTPIVGTGTWSIVSGSSTLLSQFSSATNPVAVFTPAVTGGSYVLRWTISNGSCTASTDDVVISNCTTNLISNGDFTNSATGNNNAANWTYVGTTYGSYVETYPENTYFATGNTIGFTAELDVQSSIMQTVTVVPGVSYTVSFIYAQRPGAPTPTAVNVKIKDGATTINSPTFSSSVRTPTVGTFDFTPTSSSIGIEFYNSLNGGLTLGTIIDNIVLMPSSQVAPIAVAAGGTFNTAAACSGDTVQLDVRNVPASGVTYLWTGSPGAAISSTVIKNPIITFTGSGMMQATVTVTTAGGCSISSTTYVNVNAPTATAGGALVAICQSATSVAMGGSVGGSATGGTWSGGAGSWTNASNPSTATYTAGSGESGSITLTLTTTGGSCGTASASKTITVNPAPTLATAAQTIFACDNSKATIKLTGLLPNIASTISYTIAGDTPQTVSVPADALGVGYFDTRVLTVLPDNGKTLQITAVNTASCSTTGLAINVTLTVQPNSGSIKLEGNAISGSTTFSELSTAHFSIDPIAGATGYSWTFPPTWNVTAGAGTNAITVTTGAYNDSDITVLVTASNSFCPTAVTVALSAIPPPAPVPSAIVAVSCNLLGSVTFNNLPAESWTLTTIKGSVSTVSTGSGSTSTVSNLTAGDYTFRITTARGSAVSGLVTVPDMPITTWTGGTTWSNGLPNDPAKKIILDAIGTPSGFMEGCSCTVKATANITIGSGQVLKLQNELNVETGGTLTFLNGASLVQKNDVTNSGIIHYNRTTSAVQDFDYVYWSSPVAGQTLGALSPSSDKYWSWDVDNWVKAEAGDVMAKGQGYIARVPRYISAQNVEFVGVPFNGPVTVPSKGDTKGNLVGNPYPCAVDAVKFLDTNGNFMSTETLYFWTHVGNRTLNGAGTQYVYSSNDYASFNRTGGLKAVNGGEKPNGTIAAGQSVFVIGKGTGDLVFTNSMRLDAFNAVIDNSQFFKQANTKKAQKIERNRVWLNLTNEGGAFKQLLVGYITGASNGFDKSFDGPTFNGNTFVDFYSINDSKNYAIQGRGLPFDPADEVPLGYKTTIAGTFQIGIDEADGSMVNQEIYLEDKTANTIHDLTKGSYSFTTAIGEFKDRFVLRYTDTSKLGTGDFDPKGKGVVVSVKNSQIKINSFDKVISSVKVYDIKGSLIYEKNKVDKKEWIINNLISNDQVLIIITQLEDGKRVSDKIIFRD